MRFVLKDDSNSGHCCFRYSIIDMERPIHNFEKTEIIGHETVCECFEREYAEMVLSALTGIAK